MIISEIINNNDAYHKLDLLASRFKLYHDHLKVTTVKLKDYKKICIQNKIYGQWVDILNDVDDEIHEFIELSMVINEFIKYFSTVGTSYIKQSLVVEMVEEIISLRKQLG